MGPIPNIGILVHVPNSENILPPPSDLYDPWSASYKAAQHQHFKLTMTVARVPEFQPSHQTLPSSTFQLVAKREALPNVESGHSRLGANSS